jgi:hypothetical protein
MEAQTREFETSLPVGYEDPAGRVYRRAFLRKMRGHEEALFYDPSLSAGRLVTELIKGCLLRIDGVPALDPALVSGLYSADRNYLVVELRRITLGDHLKASYACPNCGAETSVTEDLSAVAVRRLADEARPQSVLVVLEDGYQDRDGKVHREVRLRLPRGTDEEFVSRTAEADPLRARDALVLRCIESFGTLRREALEAYGVKILRDLSMGDRRRIYAALETDATGVDFRRTVRCGRCAQDFRTVLEAAGFFAPG